MRDVAIAAWSLVRLQDESSRIFFPLGSNRLTVAEQEIIAVLFEALSAEHLFRPKVTRVTISATAQNAHFDVQLGLLDEYGVGSGLRRASWRVTSLM